MEATKERKDIGANYKWRLEDIFENEDLWKKELEDINEPINELITLRGQIGKSAKNLARTLDLEQECSIRIMELYVYAKMNKDLDNSNSKYQAMYDKVVSEYFAISAKTAFVSPEISKIKTKTIKEWINTYEGLYIYKHSLDNLIRSKKHILTEREEKLLSGFGPIVDGIDESFSMMNDVELDFGEVTMTDGSKVKLTHGKFGSLREHKDREVRRQAYEKIHTAYQNFKNTIGTIYLTSVKSDVFYTRTRGYKSCVQRAMFQDNLSPMIYSELIKSVHKALPAFHKYLKLRKKVLGLSDLHLYDAAVPITKEITKEYDFDSAKKILIEGLSPLGDKYIEDMQNVMFKGGAIDVFETKGKTSGAYAWGTYKTHPFMLLNWSKRLDDVFTFAHEAGHCMHSYYSSKTQEYVNSHYPIFLAEIASTVNENILLKHMISKCDENDPKGRQEKAYLLNHFLEGVKGTVLRQTMFAEFELIVHEKQENGNELSAEVLTNVYADLLKLYFGDDVIIDEYMKYEWARIPHFYNSFYVYKYATGFCAAAKITEKIFKEGQSAVDDYLTFLSSGGSDYPGNILGKLGIDMTKSDAVNSTIREFKNNLEELEKLLV